jgi:hypothetical protein
MGMSKATAGCLIDGTGLPERLPNPWMIRVFRKKMDSEETPLIQPSCSWVE